MRKINQIAIVLILLLQVSFFSLGHTSATMFLINSYVYKTLTIFFIIFLIAINLIFNFDTANEVREYHFLTLMIGWFVIYLFILWGSQIVYNQGLVTTLKNSYIYFMIALYFLLVLFYNDQKSFDFILKSVSYIGAVYSLILIVQAFLEREGIVFLDFENYGLNPIYDSFGPIFHFIRIAGPADFISFALVVTIIRFLINRSRYSILGLCMMILDYIYSFSFWNTNVYDY
ncbi:hypothetical protein [Lapidilactobacillus gannanensis]|uniref:Uncharacterized protein n=1 Tax=Lapidilactobacillus gannanensis TaxID=2486002 RepID=A0ABW4BMJ5_9LACO|nr:hypothetical protein [Lapidilactobacillus gannanensis]